MKLVDKCLDVIIRNGHIPTNVGIFARRFPSSGVVGAARMKVLEAYHNGLSKCGPRAEEAGKKDQLEGATVEQKDGPRNSGKRSGGRGRALIRSKAIND